MNTDNRVSADALLPCPFCHAGEFIDTTDALSNALKLHISPGCELHAHIIRSVDKWNTRAASSAEPQPVVSDAPKYGGFTQLKRDADRDFPLRAYLESQGAQPLDPTTVAAYEDAMLESVEEPTIKQLLNVMLASAQTFTSESGDVVGYRIRTGALHRLVGLLGLTVPLGLPATPDTHAQAATGQAIVTEEMKRAGLEAANLCIREITRGGSVKATSVSDCDCEAIYRAMLAASPPPHDSAAPKYREPTIEDARRFWRLFSDRKGLIENDVINAFADIGFVIAESAGCQGAQK